ncbi:MAG: GNAT family N-acetyltransferase, partial [Planctomycetota bacterium]|nr:GNAT family N-acetyltransferase [Planctomycetota bacterium]
DLFADVGQYFTERGLLRVLVDAGAVVGMLGVVPRSDEVIELRKIYLAPAARGAGHGGRLLREALAHARALGARKVSLQSSTKLTEALGMYAKAGFRHVEAATRSCTCDVSMELAL